MAMFGRRQGLGNRRAMSGRRRVDVWVAPGRLQGMRRPGDLSATSGRLQCDTRAGPARAAPGRFGSGCAAVSGRVQGDAPAASLPKPPAIPIGARDPVAVRRRSHGDPPAMPRSDPRRCHGDPTATPGDPRAVPGRSQGNPR
eukprot:10696837-Lingulodinium_polyedra.AAC.1